MSETSRAWTVDESGSGARLDHFLAARLGGSRSSAQRLIRAGSVRVGAARVVRGSHCLRAGERVEVSGEPAAAGPPVPRGRVVYQDEAIVVVDKPAGLTVHPGIGRREETLAQQLGQWGGPWSSLAGPERPGIVHRLDRNTSGLLVLARSDAAHRELARQLRTRELGREYWALAEGTIREESGRIEAALGRDPARPRRMAVRADGREAITEFFVLERLEQRTALRVRLLTGRTHQIRVHLAYISHPLVNDPIYGLRPGGERPALHAASLHLRHPGSGRPLTFTSPLPDELAELRASSGAAPGSTPAWPWDRVNSKLP